MVTELRPQVVRGMPMQEPAKATLTELADLIEREHHGFLREWLPRLDHLLAEALPGVEPLRLKFDSLHSVLDQHLRSEERRVFPRIRALEARGRHAAPTADQGATTDLIEHLEFEHGIVGAMLAEIETLLGESPLPRDAQEGLRSLAANLREHVRLENESLFPRAKDLDRASSPSHKRKHSDGDDH